MGRLPGALLPQGRIWKGNAQNIPVETRNILIHALNFQT